MTIAIRFLLLLSLATTLTFGLACDDKGPMEQAGEEIDEAVEDTQAGGETFGNKVDDAVDDMREGAKDAKKEMVED